MQPRTDMRVRWLFIICIILLYNIIILLVRLAVMSAMLALADISLKMDTV